MNTGRFSRSIALIIADWPRIGLVFAALASFGAISAADRISIAIGLAALACQFAPSSRSKAFPIGPALAAASIALAAALHLSQLWHPRLEGYRHLATIIAAATAIGIAILPARLGVGRWLITAMALAAAVCAHNLAIPFTTHPWWTQLAEALAFASALEVIRSRRYRDAEDPLTTEVWSTLALIALCGHITQRAGFTLLLLAICLAAFLRRNQLRLASPNAYPFAESIRTQPAGRSRLGSGIAAALAAMLIAAASYVILLKTPFWANHARSMPEPARSIAYEARSVARLSQLDTPQLRNAIDSIDLQTWANQAADELVATYDDWQRARNTGSTRSEERDRNSSTRAPHTEPRPEPMYSQAKDRSDAAVNPTSNPPPAKAQRRERGIPFREEDELGWPALRSEITIRPAPSTLPQLSSGPSVSSTANGAIDNSIATTGPLPEAPRPTVGPRQTGSERSQPIVSSSERASAPRSGRFDDVLALRDHLTAPTSQDVVAVALAKSSGSRPASLYLRRNQLDTVTPSGFGYAADRETIVVGASRAEKLAQSDIFQTSRRTGQTVSIIAQPGFLEGLPLPESFRTIRIPKAESLTLFPAERAIAAPPLTAAYRYTLTGVDLDPRPQDLASGTSDSIQRQQALDLPLTLNERAYLSGLAQRFGGDRVARARFASNAATYFERFHPYAYEVAIPPGSEHPAVRWLRSEGPGMCSNYAAAFTLVSRSVGIPARVAVGFSTTEYDEKKKGWIVRVAHSHAWVEYEDESGRWIRFDPTPRVEEALYQEAMATADTTIKSTDNLLAVAEELIQSGAAFNESDEFAYETATAPSDAVSDIDLDTLLEQITLDQQPLDATAPASSPDANALYASGEESSDAAGETRETLGSPAEEAPAAAIASPARDAAPAEPVPAPEPGTMPESRPVSWRWVLGLALAVVMLVVVVAAALRYFVPEPSIRRSRREERQRETARKRAGRLLRKVEQSMESWSQYDYRWPAARAELQGLRYGPNPEPSALRRIEDRLRELRSSARTEA